MLCSQPFCPNFQYPEAVFLLTPFVGRGTGIKQQHAAAMGKQRFVRMAEQHGVEPLAGEYAFGVIEGVMPASRQVAVGQTDFFVPSSSTLW